MSSLYAILVAINEYPTAPLRGCVNDMHNFRDYLTAYCEHNNILFRPTILEDAEAGREAILDSFDHFRQAGPNDTCLFFYAGHGAHYPVPPEFRHLEPDGELETIVCFDSRSPDGKDLTSKELSYRLYEVCKDHKQPVITIMDCCYSGAFRGDAPADDAVAIREMAAFERKIPIDELYGFKNYHRTESGRISPPQVRRVHLGAARDLETAKEVRINGRRRGIFTYSLLHVLEEAKGIIPYDELVSRVNHIVRMAVDEQSAQLQLTRIEDSRLIFLSTTFAPDEPLFLVSHERKNGWTVNAGAIFGIPSGDEKQKNEFRLTEDDHLIQTIEVLPHLSKVIGMEGYHQNRTYSAVLHRLAQARFRLAYDEPIDPEAKKHLDHALKNKPSDIFRLTNRTDQADFLIRTSNGAFALYRTAEQKIVGRPISGLNETGTVAFLNELEIIVKWYQALLLHNPATTIKNEEISIDLFRMTEPGNYEDDTQKELVDWSTPTLFDFRHQDGVWHQPAFQCKIRNDSKIPLWVSLLYLSKNFAVTNQLIPMQALEPTHEVWALDQDQQGKTFMTLMLDLEDYYLQAGINLIEEQLKIIFCTHPFDTKKFNQKGIDPTRAPFDGVPRAFSPRNRLERPDWRCFDITFLIRRQQKEL